MLCFNPFGLFSYRAKNQSWSFLPTRAQLHVVEFLPPRDKARLGQTSKANYKLVKSVPTHVHWLQYSPLRENAARTLKVFVFFDECKLNSYMIQFMQSGRNTQMTVETNGTESRVKLLEDREHRDMANKCLEGWMSGSAIHTLDIRGDYTGRIPQNLKLTTFSFTDKYTRERSAIPAWLDNIAEGEMNFLLMSDHWGAILSHRHFANPMSTCKLTGYDGIGEEGITAINCRQIHLNNVKNEKVFNVILEKWSTGNFSDSFDWLIITSLSRSFKSEELLRNHKVQSLDKQLFVEFDKISAQNDAMEYFLVHGSSGNFAVYCGIGFYARLLVISPAVVEQIPELEKYLKT